jgi:hypothetical protein
MRQEELEKIICKSAPEIAELIKKSEKEENTTREINEYLMENLLFLVCLKAIEIEIDINGIIARIKKVCRENQMFIPE